MINREPLNRSFQLNERHRPVENDPGQMLFVERSKVVMTINDPVVESLTCYGERYCHYYAASPVQGGCDTGAFAANHPVSPKSVEKLLSKYFDIKISSRMRDVIPVLRETNPSEISSRFAALGN